MDSKEVWVVKDDINGKMTVCSTEGSAYRKVLQFYVEFLTKSLEKTRNMSDADDVIRVYETVIYDLKTLARSRYIEDIAGIHKAEFMIENKE